MKTCTKYITNRSIISHIRERTIHKHYRAKLKKTPINYDLKLIMTTHFSILIVLCVHGKQFFH